MESFVSLCRFVRYYATGQLSVIRPSALAKLSQVCVFALVNTTGTVGLYVLFIVLPHKVRYPQAHLVTIY